MPTIEITPYTGKRKSDNLVLRVLERPMPTDTMMALGGLPGFKKWEGYKLVFRPVMANIQYIRQTWPNATWMDGANEHLQAALKLDSETARVIQMKTGTLPTASSNGYQYKRLPREHQRRALLLSWDKPYFALLMEQRTGKTKVVIDNAAHLWRLRRLHTLIIVTINGVHRNWVDNEVPEDLPDWCPREAFFMRGSYGVKHQQQFEATLGMLHGLRIFSFNVEALSRDGKARNLFEQALGNGKQVMLAIDESSDCIKTYNAQRTKYLIREGSKAEYRRILTGTQSPEGKPDELFPQYLFLSESILGYDTITAYRSHFCEFAPIPVGKDAEGEVIRRDLMVPGCKNVEELRSLIEGHSFRVRRQDCMDLPPKVYKRWPVEMSKEQTRIYAELKAEYTVEMRGKTLTAALAMTRALRLQQIVCGWFPMDEPEMDGDTWKKVLAIDKVNCRLQALDDILRTNPDDHCIIWSRFRPDLELIQKHLGKRAVSYHGGISSENKAHNYKAFQSGKYQYMVANQASAGRGLTMTIATMHVYHSNSFRLIDRLQSEDRSEGDEKKRDSTLIIDIEAVGTMDTKIIRNLRRKKDIADLINGDPRVLFMEAE